VSNPAVQHLMRGQSADGGWGAYPGGASRTESTALATLALSANAADETAGAIAAGRGWLDPRQLPSGAWPLGDDAPEPSWSTSLVALALSHFAPESERIASAARWLLGQKGRGTSWWGKVYFWFFPDRRAVELDPDLIGWPWVEDTFSWVEPTSYAMMALKRLRGVVGGGGVEDRLEEADRLLVDRACRGGGWNYGNTRVLGEDLWPYPDTTALALLALADRAELPEVGGGLTALERMLAENDSILSLGLGALVFGVHGRDALPLRERLAAKLETWDGGEIRALAWAALALAESDDPLGVRGA